MHKAISNYLKGSKVPHKDLDFKRKASARRDDRVYLLIQTARALRTTLENIRKYGRRDEDTIDQQMRLMVRIDDIEAQIVNYLRSHRSEQSLVQMLNIDRRGNYRAEIFESGDDKTPKNPE